MTSRSWRWGRSSSHLGWQGLLGWADFTGGHPDDKTENATEVWLYYMPITRTHPRPVQTSRFFKSCHDCNRTPLCQTRGKISHKKVVQCCLTFLAQISSLWNNELTVSLDVPLIRFKSVSFEWGKEIENKKQQRRMWAWKHCTFNPRQRANTRHRLIWMRCGGGVIYIWSISDYYIVWVTRMVRKSTKVEWWMRRK